MVGNVNNPTFFLLMLRINKFAINRPFQGPLARLGTISPVKKIVLSLHISPLKSTSLLVDPY